jgi:hypothetical protein
MPRSVTSLPWVSRNLPPSMVRRKPVIALENIEKFGVEAATTNIVVML